MPKRIRILNNNVHCCYDIYEHRIDDKPALNKGDYLEYVKSYTNFYGNYYIGRNENGDEYYISPIDGIVEENITYEDEFRKRCKERFHILMNGGFGSGLLFNSRDEKACEETKQKIIDDIKKELEKEGIKPEPPRYKIRTKIGNEEKDLLISKVEVTDDCLLEIKMNGDGSCIMRCSKDIDSCLNSVKLVISDY